MNLKKYVTTDKAAETLRLKPETVRRYIERNLITATKIGTQWFILKTEVNRYQKERKAPGNPEFQKT